MRLVEPVGLTSGRVDPKDLAKSLYKFLATKLSVGKKTIDDVLVWTSADEIHIGICGPSKRLFDAFGGFDGMWDNSRGRLDLACASACMIPRQQAEVLLDVDGINTTPHLMMDRSKYLSLMRKWVRRATRKEQCFIHLMPDVRHRRDGLMAYSGARRMNVFSDRRKCDSMPVHKSLLVLDMPSDKRAWANREGDPPLFTAAKLNLDLLLEMQNYRAIPPVEIEYGFDLTMDTPVLMVMDPWLVQARYEPPQPNAPDAWPITLWRERMTLDSFPWIQELICQQRDGIFDSSDQAWIYTAGFPRPKDLHPDWQGLYLAVRAIRRIRESGTGTASVTGFCNAFTSSSVIRAVICHSSMTSKAKKSLESIGWRGSMYELSWDLKDPQDRARAAKKVMQEIVRATDSCVFQEPLDPTDARAMRPRTTSWYTPLPWRAEDFWL
jgi:hypothetical protein